VWRDGRGRKGNKPPNNWKAMIGGSGWHWNEGRQQFFWSSFLPFQPDLNYHHPEVKRAMLDVAKYWLAKGVDGFRLDIFNAVYEDESLQNNPFSFRLIPSEENPDGFFQKMRYNINQEKSFEFAVELRNTVDSFPGKYLIGEVFGDEHTLKKFCEYKSKKGLHTVFLFKTLRTPFKAKPYRKMVQHFESHFSAPFIPVYVYSNHDRKRSFSRLGESVKKAKLLALFQFTVRGIPYTYYGEELGMPQSEIRFKQSQDAIAHRFKPIHQWFANLAGETLNRDECRTPMLWNESAQAGFTTSSQPWLPVTPQYININVARQLADEYSLLNFYKYIIRLRNHIPSLQHGSLQIAGEYCSRKVFAYYRMLNDQKILVLLNMSKSKVKLSSVDEEEIVLSTRHNIEAKYLLPYEGRLMMVKKQKH
jgi:glycosidase